MIHVICAPASRYKLKGQNLVIEVPKCFSGKILDTGMMTRKYLYAQIFIEPVF